MATAIATQATTSQKPKPITPRASKSRPRAAGSSGGSVPAMREALREIGIVDREERTLLELPEEDGEPDAADAERRGDVEPVQLELDASRRRGRLREGGPHEPVHVDEAHQDDQRRDARDAPGVAVGAV